VDRSLVVVVLDRDAGCLQSLRVRDALLAQRVELIPVGRSGPGRVATDRPRCRSGRIQTDLLS